MQTTLDEEDSIGGLGTRLWALWAMSRPSQLLLILVVYALGVAMAVATGGTFTPEVVGVGALVLLPAAASVHYANEYADYETDQLATQTLFSGGSGALKRTGLPRSLPARAAIVTGGLAVVVGTVVFTGPVPVAGGLPLAAAGILAVILVFGWLYSVPRSVAFAWNGLGAVDNAFLGGVALPLYGFAVVTGRVDAWAVIACLPFALLVFLNLLETTWPDREADGTVGKATLATRWSPDRLRRAYRVGAVAWLASSAAVWAVVPFPVCLVGLLPVPLVAWGWVRYTRREAPLPTVVGMVVLAVGLLAAWTAVAVDV